MKKKNKEKVTSEITIPLSGRPVWILDSVNRDGSFNFINGNTENPNP